MKYLICASIYIITICGNILADTINFPSGYGGYVQFHDTVGYAIKIGGNPILVNQIISVGLVDDIGIWANDGTLVYHRHNSIAANGSWNLDNPLILQANKTYILGCANTSYGFNQALSYGGLNQPGYPPSYVVSPGLSLVGVARNNQAWVFSMPEIDTGKYSSNMAVQGPNISYTIISSPLEITTQPQNVFLTATNRQTATFRVGVTNGLLPYTYQWMKDGVELTNQTNATLVLSNAAANNVGYYSCNVTDQNGSTVNSSNAALNITGVPFYLSQGLVAYYPLNGDLNDYSQNKNNLNGKNIVFSGGVKNGELSCYLDENKKLISTKNIGISGNSHRTISLWIKPLENIRSNAFGYNESTLLFWGHAGEGDWNHAQALGLSADSFWSDWANKREWAEISWTTNHWMNLVYVYSGNQETSELYLNGSLQTSRGGVNYIGVSETDTGDSPVTIGELVGLKANFSSIRIYNRALSSNEVASLYALESTPPSGVKSGIYNGLIGTGSIGTGSAADIASFSGRNGFLSVNIASNNSYTGILRIEGRSHPFSGTFTPGRTNSVTVARPGRTSAVIAMESSTSPVPGALSGTVTIGTTKLDFVAPLNSYTQAAQHPLAGKRYTLTLVRPSGITQGNGSAQLAVSRDGSAVLSGRLPTGGTVAAGGRLVDDGVGNWILPVYVASEGVVTGEIVIPKVPATGSPAVTGTLSWLRAPNAAAKLYKSGFLKQISVTGSLRP